MEWDAFTCHASEDKDFVRPLVEELRNRGLNIWFDETSMTLGDNLRRKIDEGLAKSRYGIVVLSKHFFEKEWSQWELDGLLNRQMDGAKVIIPIWHGVTREDVLRYSPSLAGLVAAESKDGLPEVVKRIMKVLRPDSVPEFEDVGGFPAWVRLSEFMTHSRIDQLVNSPQFLSEFPPDLPHSEYVDKLCTSLGKNLSPERREMLTQILNSGTATRGQVLRAVQESMP